jgi:hypothetical protein
MTDVERLPSFTRRGLRFVAFTAALTGFWLVPTALIAAINQRGVQHWAYATFGLIMLVGGVLGWSRYSNSGSRRRELVRITQTVSITFVTFVIAWVVAGDIGINHRVCLPGETNGPSTIFWLAPMIAYYSIGYAGFARSRWIRFLWPLAVVVGVFALLAVGLIWTTGSGCGD